MEFEDLMVKLILAMPDDAILNVPSTASDADLIRMFPDLWERICKEQQAAATICDDRIQTPTFGKGRR